MIPVFRLVSHPSKTKVFSLMLPCLLRHWVYGSRHMVGARCLRLGGCATTYLALSRVLSSAPRSCIIGPQALD